MNSCSNRFGRIRYISRRILDLYQAWSASKLGLEPSVAYLNYSRQMTSSQPSGLLIGEIDHYNGITVKSESNPEYSSAGPELEKALIESLKEWREKGIRGCWIEIKLKHSEWVPICAKAGFVFHNGRGDRLVMTTWLQPDQPNHLPLYAFTTIGVGGIVRDDQGRFLMMREQRGPYLGWKFPGGLLDPGEDIHDGVAREVLEETGIDSEMLGLISMRQMHKFRWPECSDMYFMAVMRPKGSPPYVPKPCANETAECKWMTFSYIMNTSRKNASFEAENGHGRDFPKKTYPKYDQQKREEMESLEVNVGISAMSLYGVKLLDDYAGRCGQPNGFTLHKVTGWRNRKYNLFHLEQDPPKADQDASIATSQWTSLATSKADESNDNKTANL